MSAPLVLSWRRRRASVSLGEEDASVPLRDALPADSLVETIGVGLHATSDPYGSVSLSQFAADITALGVRHVRMERVVPGTARQTTLVNALPAGTRVLTIMDDRGAVSPSTSWAHVQANWTREVVAASGPNEPNISASVASSWPLTGTYDGSSNYMPVSEAGRQQQLVWDTKPSGATVACSPLALRDKADWFPRQAVGYGNPLPFSALDLHMYQGGRRFQKNGTLTTLVTAARAQYGAALPLWLSETGYHNLIGTSDSHKGTSEGVAAIYAAEFPYAVQSENLTRAYLYELYNETGLSGREANFGLYSAPGTPKPIATALGGILGRYADPGAAYTPAPLRVDIAGTGSNFRSALHQKRNGTWLLAMWRRAELWDFNHMVPIAAPAANTITVKLGSPRTVTGWTPTSSASATMATTVTAQWQVPIAEHLHIFEIT